MKLYGLKVERDFRNWNRENEQQMERERRRKEKKGGRRKGRLRKLYDTIINQLLKNEKKKNEFSFSKPWVCLKK